MSAIWILAISGVGALLGVGFFCWFLIHVDDERRKP